MATNLNRRKITSAIGMGAFAMAATKNVQPSEAAAATPPDAPTPVSLSFDPSSIPGLSQRLITSHFENNYGGAVRRLNAINEQLANMDFGSTPGFNLNGLKREQLLAINAVILHEIYFAGLGAGGDPKGTLASALERDFGSVSKWRSEFSSMGKALSGGSGWVHLTYSNRLGRLENFWSADHSMTVADGEIVLALDMYEHSYHMDFGSNAGAYVDAFMSAINWDYAQTAFKNLG